MPQYILVYVGGEEPSNRDAGEKHMAEYMEWISGLGDKAVSPANPLKQTRTVHPDGSVTHGSSTTMSGYTVIDVETMDEALSIATACPFLNAGGSLEVSELGQMPG